MAPSVGVKQRNGVQIHHGFRIAVFEGHAQRMQVQRPVRQRHAFGRAGTPAGIKEFGDGHLVIRKNIGALGPALVENFFIGQIGFRNSFVQRCPISDIRAVPAQVADDGRKIVLEDGHFRARMAQNRGQLRFGKADVQRHHDGARLDHAEVAFEQLVVVVAEVRHAIASRDAELLQAGGQPLRALSELGEGKLPVPRTRRRFWIRTDPRRGAGSGAA